MFLVWPKSQRAGDMIGVKKELGYGCASYFVSDSVIVYGDTY
jgi:hypothetical protein